jgi:hypothetical protein
VFITSHAHGKVRPETDLTTPETILIDGVPWGTEVSTGSLATIITGAISDMNSALTTYLGALTHIRNITYGFGTPTGNYQDSGIYYSVRMDAPVGLLCGVITKGEVKYYIWRKTLETRSGRDYERGQQIYMPSGGIE